MLSYFNKITINSWIGDNKKCTNQNNRVYVCESVLFSHKQYDDFEFAICKNIPEVIKQMIEKYMMKRKEKTWTPYW